MRSVTKFLEVELKLKVNETKSKIGKPWEVKFLGFSFYSKKRRDIGIRIHEKSINRFKETVRETTCRKWSIDMETRISILNQKIIGWVGYFAVSDMKRLSKDLDKAKNVLLETMEENRSQEKKLGKTRNVKSKSLDERQHNV